MVLFRFRRVEINQRLLHLDGGQHRFLAVFKGRHDGVANGLDHPATMILDDLAQAVIALMHHHEPGHIAIFLEISGRSLDVGKHHGDEAAKLFQLSQKLVVSPRGLDDLCNAVRLHVSIHGCKSCRPVDSWDYIHSGAYLKDRLLRHNSHARLCPTGRNSHNSTPKSQIARAEGSRNFTAVCRVKLSWMPHPFKGIVYPINPGIPPELGRFRPLGSF